MPSHSDLLTKEGLRPAAPSELKLPPAFTPELLTKEELRQRLNVPHVRIIEEMARKRKIPVVKLGYRTLRFNWAKVQAALEKLTVKEVGA
jgi:excisionase family DNA binding protein